MTFSYFLWKLFSHTPCTRRHSFSRQSSINTCLVKGSVHILCFFLLSFFFYQVLLKAALTCSSVNRSSYLSLQALSSPIMTRALHPAGVVGGDTCGKNKICIVKIRQCTICFWSSSTYQGGIPSQCLSSCMQREFFSFFIVGNIRLRPKFDHSRVASTGSLWFFFLFFSDCISDWLFFWGGAKNVNFSFNLNLHIEVF